MENSNDVYYHKYLKYKQKYLELKKLLGGGVTCIPSGNSRCTKGKSGWGTTGKGKACYADCKHTNK
jgi:hypothetical protein